jgi:hypothetical protein
MSKVSYVRKPVCAHVLVCDCNCESKWVYKRMCECVLSCVYEYVCDSLCEHLSGWIYECECANNYVHTSVCLSVWVWESTWLCSGMQLLCEERDHRSRTCFSRSEEWLEVQRGPQGHGTNKHPVFVLTEKKNSSVFALATIIPIPRLSFRSGEPRLTEDVP